MSSDVAIRVDQLGKAYLLRHQDSDHVTLTQVAIERLKHPMRRQSREEFWALSDVSFEVQQGEVLGLVGRNGAGKSTLLKLLTRITAPSAGRIDLWGRVGSLLEVGTGFHPELTGRENVYLNGSILGMSRKEIDRQFDAIVEFAGVERFLDTPVKRYSSGMYVRLAFAIAAHLDTEILLLDEVLAVGDADFQERCFQKVSSLATSGRTVILVSHNLTAIRQFTSRCLLLEGGAVASIGPTEDVLAHYSAGDIAATVADVGSLPRMDRTWGTEARIRALTINDGDTVVAPDQPLRVQVTVEASTPHRAQRASLQISSLAGGAVGHAFSEPLVDLQVGTNQFVLTVRDHLLSPGRYAIGVAVGSGGPFGRLENLDGILDAAVFDVSSMVNDQGTVGSWNPAWGSINYRELEVSDLDARPADR